VSVFEELHKQLRVWGRLTFADDESHADIVITLDSEASAAVTSGGDEPAWVLRINAPGARPLHGDREAIVGNGFSGIELLVGRLMKVVDTANPASTTSPPSPPSATSSDVTPATVSGPMVEVATTTAPATAPARREPCRVSRDGGGGQPFVVHRGQEDQVREEVVWLWRGVSRAR
jgi:hypothetical protein